MAKFKISILLFSLLFISPVLSFSEENENTCIECHNEMEGALQEPIAKWSVSIHKAKGISCEDCHGGDPTSYDEAMEPSKDYRGAPKKAEIPGFCGRCHSDIKRMRKFNIRTDQLSAYKTSKHGIRLLKEGDLNVAVCTDCHGKHDILAKNDPNSPAYRFNVPDTCNRCHGNGELMKQYNRSHNQLELYKESVHGKPLYEEQNLRVATCPDCHGVHGAVPPGVKEIGFVCRNCHNFIFEYFQAGPHFNGDKSKNTPNCVSCHSNHGIQKPTLEKFSGHSKLDCGGCHKEDSFAFQKGLSIKEKIIKAKSSVTEAEDMLRKLRSTRGSGFETSNLENKIDKARTKMIEAIPVSHSLSLEKIDGKLDKVMVISETVKEDIAAKFVDIKGRRYMLIFSWLLILAVVFLIGKLRKTMPH